MRRLAVAAVCASATAFAPVRAVLGGAGTALFGEDEVVDAVLALCDRREGPLVAYLGTATYDLRAPREAQTRALAARGARVAAVDVARARATRDDLATLARADAVLVSGGNTLYAVDRWRRAGLVAPLRAAMERGAVLCGGSAGAICWFDGGHSDSMDPESFLGAALARHARGGAGAADDASAAAAPGAAAAAWEYIRVPGLGFLPGLCCPHHDRVQSNGVPRADDFDRMLARHPGEVGVAIDHFSALVVDEGRYRVLSIPRLQGDRGGTPWVFRKHVEGGEVRAARVPQDGGLHELTRAAVEIASDPRLDLARAQNPSAID